MKIKIFLFSIVFCFFCFINTAFASPVDVIESAAAARFNEPTLSYIKTNIAAGNFLIADSYFVVPRDNLSGKSGLVIHSEYSKYPWFTIGDNTYFAAVFSFNTDFTEANYISGSSSPQISKQFYSDSVTYPGGTNLGSSSDFFLRSPAVTVQTLAGGTGNLMNHFGETSTTLLLVGIAIFSLLLVVPLIPRLVRLFL